MVRPIRIGPAGRPELTADAKRAALAEGVRTGLALAAEQPSRDAIIDITRAGVVRSWNPPAVLLYGYLQDDMIGRAADVLCPPAAQARKQRSARGSSPAGRRSDTKRTGSARTGRSSGCR